MCEQDIETRKFEYHEAPVEAPAEFPTFEHAVLLRDDFQSRNGHFLRLLDCEGIRYSLRLAFNDKLPDCLENTLLENMYQAFEERDMDVHRKSLEQAAASFMKLFWPFLHHDFISHSQNGTLMNPVDPLDFASQDCHKLQLKTVGGVIHPVEHHLVPSHDFYSFANTYTDVCCVRIGKMELLEKVSCIVYKVRVNGEVYALKAARSQAMRVVEKLHGAKKHPNVLDLCGVAANSSDRIVGLLAPFVSGKLLSEIASATASQKAKWKTKITDAIHFLHKQNIAWGDAKPDNIMIKKGSDEPILIDFEGGYTPGWVDRELCNSMEGDVQALRRILKAVDDIPTINNKGTLT